MLKIIQKLLESKFLINKTIIKRTITSKRKKFLKVPNSHYGGRQSVTVIPGDGIGPEILNHVKKILEYSQVPLDFEMINVSKDDDEAEKDIEYAITSIKRNGVGLKSSIDSKNDNIKTTAANINIRNELDLYASVMHCKSYPGIPARYDNVDIFIVRQNTEGEYAQLEHENKKGVVECLKIMTAKNLERLCRYAFELAVKNQRKKVTTVHKANIMKITDGLFLEVSKKVAKNYPQIKHDNIIIDNCCMQLVSNPYQFDILLTTNLYGSICGNVICGLIGGPGLYSQANYGENYAVFENGTRNTGKSIIGKNIANPIALLNASLDMLDYLGLNLHSQVIREAICKTILIDKIRTPDICGKATTNDIVNNVLKYLDKNVVDWQNQCIYKIE